MKNNLNNIPINNFPINSKKILCQNILNDKKCKYGDKCMYAHNLAEQTVDFIKEKIYTIIANNDVDLSKINLITDTKLYNALFQLTKLCSLCMKNLCPG